MLLLDMHKGLTTGRKREQTQFWSQVSGTTGGPTGYTHKSFSKTPSLPRKVPYRRKISTLKLAEQRKRVQAATPKLSKLSKKSKLSKTPKTPKTPTTPDGPAPPGNPQWWTEDEDELLKNLINTTPKLPGKVGGTDWRTITKGMREKGVRRPDDAARNRFQRMEGRQGKATPNARPKKCRRCGLAFAGHSCSGRRMTLTSTGEENEENVPPAGASLDTLAVVAGGLRDAELVCAPCPPAAAAAAAPAAAAAM